jgi:hypothetical protein
MATRVTNVHSPFESIAAVVHKNRLYIQSIYDVPAFSACTAKRNFRSRERNLRRKPKYRKSLCRAVFCRSERRQRRPSSTMYETTDGLPNVDGRMKSYSRPIGRGFRRRSNRGPRSLTVCGVGVAASCDPLSGTTVESLYQNDSDNNNLSANSRSDHLAPCVRNAERRGDCDECMINGPR